MLPRSPVSKKVNNLETFVLKREEVTGRNIKIRTENRNGMSVIFIYNFNNIITDGWSATGSTSGREIDTNIVVGKPETASQGNLDIDGKDNIKINI